MCDNTRSIRRATALLAGLTCGVLIAPAAAQDRAGVRASAQVLVAPVAPVPATVLAWVGEWRLHESGASGGAAHPSSGRVAGRRWIESELWTATLAEQCGPARERRCGVLVTIVFARN